MTPAPSDNVTPTLPPPPARHRDAASSRRLASSMPRTLRFAVWGQMVAAACIGLELLAAGGLWLFSIVRGDDPTVQLIAALLFEEAGTLLVALAVALPLHIAAVVGLRRLRRWGIALHALLGLAYGGVIVRFLVSGWGEGSEDGQQSRLVLSLFALAVIAVCNALALVNWPRAR